MDIKELKEKFFQCDDFCAMVYLPSQHSGKCIKIPLVYGTPQELLDLEYEKGDIEPCSPDADELMKLAIENKLW